MDADTENLMVKYYNDGLSYQLIAEKMPPFTKNMIISRVDKLRRAGKVAKRKSTRGNVNELTRVQKRREVVNSSFIALNAWRNKELPRMDIDRVYTKLDNPIQYMSLTRKMCQFPYEGNEWCGHSVVEGSPYCEVHHKECYRGIKK